MVIRLTCKCGKIYCITVKDNGINDMQKMLDVKFVIPFTCECGQQHHIPLLEEEKPKNGKFPISGRRKRDDDEI